jgi:hypothetical protein
VFADTEYGGLFYLLSLISELELSESLWKVCLHEGLVLARLFTELLPPADQSDPAPRLIGGVADAFAPLEVLREQQETVATELLNTLRTAIPRRGLAALPPIRLVLENRSNISLLLAVPAETPAAIYVSVSEDRDSLLSGMQSFLQLWPRSAPSVTASPGLAAADPFGRLRASSERMLDVPLLNFNTHPIFQSALLTQAAGSLIYLFAARAGWDIGSWREFAMRLKIPARVTWPDADTMSVHLPADCVQIELRRAGLDCNPGRIPWLRRSVELVFASDE